MFNPFKLFGGTQVNYRELVQQGAIIIDVRSPDEFRGGHIAGSRNIPVDQLSGKIADLKKVAQPVIAVCTSGMRSGMAKTMLTAAGITAYNGGPWSSLQT
ncbi:MAG: rhodanese-like domain-containing protein, partial [Chitinophagaceae bacterium]